MIDAQQAADCLMPKMTGGRVTVAPTKTCSKCGILKPADSFYPSKVDRSGLSSRCKDCTKGALKDWRVRNPERDAEMRRGIRRRNYEKTLDQTKERNKKRYKPHIDQISDGYVIRLLKIPKQHVTRELIDTKRVHIKIIRLIKEQK